MALGAGAVRRRTAQPSTVQQDTSADLEDEHGLFLQDHSGDWFENLTLETLLVDLQFTPPSLKMKQSSSSGLRRSVEEQVCLTGVVSRPDVIHGFRSSNSVGVRHGRGGLWCAFLISRVKGPAPECERVQWLQP